MLNMKGTRREKIILVPYPAQGHVTPMLKLASLFVNLGFTPVLVTPDFIHRRIAPQLHPKDEILCMPIPDGLDDATPRDFFAVETAMENHMPVHLERLIGQIVEDEEGGIACMVVDLLASWGIKVAEQHGIQVAGFWPAMLATYRLIAAIPVMVRTGLISETGSPLYQGPLCFAPDQPMLTAEDLPWLIGSSIAKSKRFKFWSRTLDRCRNLRWILVNTFLEECYDEKSKDQIINDSQYYPLIFPVGPLSKHEVSKNVSFWDEDMICLDWLEKQSPCSTLYISFGSWVSPLGEENVKNLALTLEESGQPFIWVLGPTWRKGLPIGYIDRVSKQGKVVSWAPQVDVLQHRAVGCYLTHCGWNSIMEAIQCKKRLLCYPVAGDQFVNCRYVVNKWRIGLKISGFGQEILKENVKRVMADNKMMHRLLTLNARIMGNETNTRVMVSLTTFMYDVKKVEESSPIQGDE